MATTSNAAMRKKTPFYVSIFLIHDTSIPERGDPARPPACRIGGFSGRHRALRQMDRAWSWGKKKEVIAGSVGPELHNPHRSGDRVLVMVGSSLGQGLSRSFVPRTHSKGVPVIWATSL